MNLIELNKLISQGDFGGAFLFYGNEKFLVRHFIEIFKKKVIAPGTEQMNFVRFEDSKDVEAIIAVCETYPVFAERKLVLVKNSGLFAASKRAQSQDLQESQESESESPSDDTVENLNGKGDSKDFLVDFLKDVPPYCCLIFQEDNVAKNVKAYKAIAANGVVVEFDKLSDSDLPKWIARTFSEHGKKVSTVAIDLLIRRCNNNMDELNNEISKISALVGERTEIAESDVANIAGITIKTAVFEITNALAKKDVKRAFVVLDELTQLNEPIQRLFIMITKRFGQYLLLKDLINAGVSEDVAVVKAGFSPNQKRFVVSESKAFTQKYLQSFVKRCNKLDLDIKNGRLSDRTALELLISGAK